MASILEQLRSAIDADNQQLQQRQQPQTPDSILGRLRQRMDEDAALGPEPGYIETAAKGVVRGTENLLQSSGSVLRWAGDVVGSESVSRAGGWWRDYWKEAAANGWEAPDPRTFRGEFMDNPSLKRAMGVVFEALPSVALPFGIGTAARIAGAGLKTATALGVTGLSALEGSSTYEGAREAGKGVGEASAYGAISTAGIALLEALPLGRMLRLGDDAGKGILRETLEQGPLEAITEGTQQIFQNLVAKIGYDDTQQLFEGLAESLIGGYGAGTIAAPTVRKLNDVIRKHPDKDLAEDVRAAQASLQDDIQAVADEAKKPRPTTDTPAEEDLARVDPAAGLQSGSPQADLEHKDLLTKLGYGTAPVSTTPRGENAEQLRQEVRDAERVREQQGQEGQVLDQEGNVAQEGLEEGEETGGDRVLVSAPPSGEQGEEALGVPEPKDPRNAEFVRNKVAELGNVEAVDAFYTTDTVVGNYARAYARQYYGASEEATPAISGSQEALETFRKVPPGIPGVEKNQAALDHIAEKGTEQVFTELGWPRDPDAQYRRFHDGQVKRLEDVYGDLQNIGVSGDEARKPANMDDDTNLATIMRVWEPMPSQEEIRARLEAIDAFKKENPDRVKLFLGLDYRPVETRKEAWRETTFDKEIGFLSQALEGEVPATGKDVLDQVIGADKAKSPEEAWKDKYTRAGRFEVAQKMGWDKKDAERIAKTDWQHLAPADRKVLEDSFKDGSWDLAEAPTGPTVDWSGDRPRVVGKIEIPDEPTFDYGVEDISEQDDQGVIAKATFHAEGLAHLRKVAKLLPGKSADDKRKTGVSSEKAGTGSAGEITLNWELPNGTKVQATIGHWPSRGRLRPDLEGPDSGIGLTVKLDEGKGQTLWLDPRMKPEEIVEAIQQTAKPYENAKNEPKWEIGQYVRPRQGSGISRKNAGKITHIRRHEDGSEWIKTTETGNMHFAAGDWEAVPEKQPEATGRTVLAYQSGADRRAAIRGLKKAGQPVGASVLNLSPAAYKELLDYMDAGGKVLLDNGAFGSPGEVPSNQQVKKVLSHYRHAANNTKHPGNLTVIAPDVIGNQEFTRSLIEDNKKALQELAAMGVNIILPVQKGKLSPAEMWGDMYEALDYLYGGVNPDRLIAGIPANKSAFTPEEMADLFKPSEMFKGSKPPTRVHLLGMGPTNTRFEAMMAAIPEGVDVSSDATGIRTKIPEIKAGTVTAQDEISVEKMDEQTSTIPEWIGPQIMQFGVEELGIEDETEVFSELEGMWDDEWVYKAKDYWDLTEEEVNHFRMSSNALASLQVVLAQRYGDQAAPLTKEEKGDARAEAVAGAMSEGRASRPHDDVAKYVVKKLEAGKTITAQMLFNQANKAYGGSQAEGRYSVKQAYDALELGINQYILGNLELAKLVDGEVRRATPKEVIDQLKDILARVPTQSKRTDESDEFQQFSTPPPLAYVANWVASVQEGDQYLEPSAGVGGLAIFGRMTGAGQIVVNEIGENRKQLLQSLPFNTYISEDAAQIGNMRNASHMKNIRPDTIVMNPPFSATAGRIRGRRNTMEGAKHLEQALTLLKENGRLVAITGKGMAMDKPAFTKWWNKIKAKYTVRANVRVSGQEYRKYGTTFDNQLIVIDKSGPTTEDVITGAVELTEDLIPILQEVKDARVPGSEQRPGQPAGQEEAAPGEGNAPAGRPALQPATDGLGVGGEQGGPALAGGQHPLPAGETPGQRPEPGSGVAVRGVQPDGRDQSAGVTGERGVDLAEPLSDEAGSGAARVSVVEKKQERRKGEISDSLYEGYTPERVSIKGAQHHPTPLVQSAAMAAVTPPKPTYELSLPQKTIKGDKHGRGVSDIQIEAAMYAGQAHEQTLPDGSRQGYFIGDGTGVGKGREIAAIILDNWNKGRKKHVWISEKAALFKDAKRDVDNIAWDSNLVFPLSKVKIDAPIKSKQGILFTTYDTVKSKRVGENPASRIDQIVDWVGEDFDGVIAFDESHNMGNAIPIQGVRGTSRPSKKALAGIELQERLPNARVVYVSATGATEVINLAYAQRLGLWGEGMPFASNINFVNDITAGGIAAMEMVAQDLKAMGKYTARSLSYDGVQYDRIVHDLNPDQTEQYNTMAEAWQIVLRNINEALEETGGVNDRNAKAQAMSQFWGAHQRFFNQVMTSMSLPSVVGRMKADLAAGKSIVIQLTNTYEAAQERGLARLTEDDTLEDLDLSPFDDLMNFVERAFPVTQFEEYLDENGNMQTRPVVDSQGNPVQNADAVAMREDLLNQLGAMRGQIADGPLDAIIDVFGTELVAEVTGRKRRVVMADTDEGRQRVIEKRSDAKAAADARAFMAGKKRVLIFSEKGGTGLSYHADLASENQQTRAHYLLQAGWRADKAVQGLGRTHRSNQAQPPEYYLVTTNLKGQKRFISSIARRLDQLGALTKGSRKTGSQGIFSAKDNLESEHASEGLRQFFYDMYLGDIPNIGIGEFQEQTGLNLLTEQGNLVAQLPDITRFLNRLLSLSVDRQAEVFDAFEERLDAAFNRRLEAGTLNVGVETLQAQKIEKVSEEEVFTHPSGAATRYIQLNITQPNKRKPWAVVKNSDYYIQNKRSSKVWAVRRFSSVDNETGNRVTEHTLYGPAYNMQRHPQEFAEERLEKGDWIELTKDQAKGLWESQYNELPETVEYKEHILTGLLLPIWDRLLGHPRLYRIQTDEGEQFIGRRIDEQYLNQTLTNLGASGVTIDMPAEDIYTNVFHNNYTIKLANAWELVRRKVSGEDRIELKNIEWGDYKLLEKYGVFSERINWNTRYFIPTEKTQAITALEGVMLNRQIVQAQPPVSSRYQGGDTQLAKGNFDPRRAINAMNVGTVSQSAEIVWNALKKSGIPASQLKNIEVQLKTIIDLRGKDTKASLKQWDELNKAASAILGATTIKNLRATIELSLEQDLTTMERTAYHEALHIVARWVLPEAEYQRMLRLNKNNEELAADNFAEFMQGRGRPTGWLRRIYLKLRNILRRIGNALRGEGFAITEDIFQGIASGKYQGGREAADGTSVALMAEQRAQVWRSQMEDHLKAKLPGSGSPKQIIQTLDAWARKGLIKAEELEWSGLKEWLKGEYNIEYNEDDDTVRVTRDVKQKVTKDEILKWLDRNNVKLAEVLNSDEFGVAVNEFLMDRGYNPTDELIEYLTKEMSRGEADPIDLAEENDLHFEGSDVDAWINLYDEVYENYIENTQHSNWQEPGGTNYQELLITMPPKWWYPGRADYPSEQARQEVFETGHWDTPNVLAHVRFNDRTGPNGERILFLEEVQSDWHQRGRKKGYRKPEHIRISSKAERGETLTDEEMRIYREEMGANIVQHGAVPDAPFKKTWPMLAMKRMVRYAAEHGYDQIAWTPGKIQADRYNLAKHVERLYAGKNDNGTWDLVFDVVGTEQRQEVLAIPENKIEDYVGKDLAKKIINEEGPQDRQDGDMRIYKDKDLQVGGEGMVGFYDKIMPSVVGKFFGKKAWGNAKIGKMPFGEPGPTMEVVRLEPVGGYPVDFTEDDLDFIDTLGESPDPTWAVMGEDGGVVEEFFSEEEAQNYADQHGASKQFEAWTLPITKEMRDKALTEGVTMFRKKPPVDEGSVYDEVLPPEPAKSMKAAKLKKTPLKDRVKDALVTAVETFRPNNAFPLLRKPAFAKAREIVRNVVAISNYSKWKAAKEIRQILQPDALSARQYDAFSLKIILDDMLYDIEDENGALYDWEVKHGKLPFEFANPEQVRESLQKLQSKIDADPAIKDALDRREKYMKKLRQDLVRNKLLPQSVLNDPRYFHHQVLKYANEKRRYGLGVGQQDIRVHKKGYQMHRIGDISEYNTEYVTAEYEVIAQGVSQLETLKNQRELGREYNIIQKLTRKASLANYIAVVGGPEKFKELQQLKARREELRQSGSDSATKREIAKLTDQIWQLDPTMPFRAKIAIGLAKIADTGAPEGSRYQQYIDLDDLSFTDIQRLADDGDVGALTVLKGVSDRRKFYKETLGRKFNTYQTMMAQEKPMGGSEGWVEWVPKPGSAWYMANTISDKLIEQMLAGLHQLEEADVKQIIARGRDARWVIPAELASVMDGEDFMHRPHENVVARASEEMLNGWKRWILINPMRVVKYNLNNMSGDLDIVLAYNYRILKHAKQAAKDLWAFHYNKEMGEDLKKELDTAVRNDVIGSGMTAHDIPDIGKHADFDKLMTAVRGEKKTAISYIKKFWEGSKNFTTWRENILRLAAYRYFKAELMAGNTNVFGVSDPNVVRGTDGTNRKAALLARELIGDYGNLSKGGQWLRRKMIPFYSWMEINAPRYWRLFKNLPLEGERGRRKWMTAVMVKKGTVLTAKAAMLYAAVHAFNRIFWPDEEEEIGAAGRRQLHLIIGRNDDGTIRTIRFQGALSDALAWVGAEDLPEDLAELAQGKKSVSDWAKEAALATPNRLVNAIRPEVKTGFELLAGETVYPDISKPRQIRDRVEHAARLYSLDALWRRVSGKPSKEKTLLGKFLGDMARTVTYTSDPGEAAYHDARSIVFKYLEDQGVEKPAAEPTTRSNALYYFRKAIVYGDIEAQQKYLRVYAEKGGTPRGLKTSIQRQHPLAAIPKKQRLRFALQLRGKDRETVKRAIQWYQSTYQRGANG